MVRSSWRLIAVSAVCVCVLVGLGLTSAQDKAKQKGTNVNPAGEAKSTPAANAVAQIALANSLIEYGRKAKSPEALLTAAQILKRVPAPPAKEEKPETSKNEGPAPPAGKKADKPQSDKPEDLLAEAKKMRPDDKHLAALADEIASEKVRGTPTGGTTWRGRVDVNHTNWHKRTFVGGEYAWATANGDGDTTLTMTVRDQNGNHITSSTGFSPSCSWNPIWTGPFTIYVRNNGGVYNEYTMTTN
jgi:hypothetical protein